MMTGKSKTIFSSKLTAYGGPTHATGSQQIITPNVQSLIQDGGVLILTV